MDTDEVKDCSTCRYREHNVANLCGECLFSDSPEYPYWAPIINPEEEMNIFNDWDDEEWDI